MAFSSTDDHPRTSDDSTTEELRTPQSAGELWAGIVAGTGLVLGVGSLFYKPLLFGTFAVILVVIGAVGDDGGKIAKVAVPVTAVCAFLGMVMAIFVTHKPAW